MKKEKIEIRVTPEQKTFIKNKSDNLGYKYLSSFLINSSYNHFVIDMDLTHFDNVAKEINYIGKNINNLVHHIFTIGTYSKHDLNEIRHYQKEIYNRINKEYDYLLKLRKRYRESEMSLDDKERLINELNKKDINVPKEVLLDKVFEQIRNNILYICQMIEDSPEQEEGISDYVYEYMFDGNLFELSKDDLISFSDEVYLFAEKIKMKTLNINNVFDDDDWFELKDILDKYEDL